MGGRANGGRRDLHGKALSFFFFSLILFHFLVGSDAVRLQSRNIFIRLLYFGALGAQVPPVSQYGVADSRLELLGGLKHCRVLHGSSGHAMVSNTGIVRPCDQMTK